jgi:uncharacterized membrane protein YjjP (DUF1212 family)
VRTKGAACFATEARRVMANKKTGFPPWLSFAARVISPPLAVAVFFGGTFVDMIAAFCIGFVVGLLSLVGVVKKEQTTKNENFGFLF